MPCTTLLVGKNASYDGSTIVARNEDSEEGQFNPKRFAALRGRTWLAQLQAELAAMRSSDGRIHLPIEIIYGHAFKPAMTHTASGESVVSLEQLRKNLAGK